MLTWTNLTIWGWCSLWLAISSKLLKTFGRSQEEKTEREAVWFELYADLSPSLPWSEEGSLGLTSHLFPPMSAFISFWPLLRSRHTDCPLIPSFWAFKAPFGSFPSEVFIMAKREFAALSSTRTHHILMVCPCLASCLLHDFGELPAMFSTSSFAGSCSTCITPSPLWTPHSRRLWVHCLLMFSTTASVKLHWALYILFYVTLWHSFQLFFYPLWHGVNLIPV